MCFSFTVFKHVFPPAGVWWQPDGGVELVKITLP